MPWTPLILDEAQFKYPFWTTVVPDDYLPFIGHVTVLWGFYEDLFDEFLEAMVWQSGKEPGPGWKTRHYSARKRMFKQQAKLCFKDSEPILEYISKMLTDSVSLQRDRNILTHGKIGATERDYGEDLIEATGYVKRKLVTVVVDQKMLTCLFHGLGHLAGRMQYLQDAREPDEDQPEENLPLRQPERLVLRDFWSRSCLIRANAKKPAPPRQSSRG